MENESIKLMNGEIPPNWQITTLKDVCLPNDGVLTGPFGSQLHQRDYRTSGTPIITVEHLGDNHIIHQDLPRVSDEDCKRLSRYELRAGDIVFSRVGSVDRRALVRDDERGWLFSGRCLRIRLDPNKADPAFLSWFFGLPSFKEYIRQVAVGATMPSLNTKILSDVEIILPPLPEQRVIAGVLNSINDKILLNHQMNVTLEQIGQAIFKRWFVDFEFPNEVGNPYKSSGGEMFDSELGPTPFGWEVKELSGLAEIVKKTVMPQEFPETSFQHYSIPAYDQGEKPVLNKGQEIKSMKFLIDNESVLVSKLNPEKMRIWLPFVSQNVKAICSTEFIVFNAKKGLSRVFIYCVAKTSKFSDFFSSLVTGSTGSRQRVSPKDTLSYKIAFPKEDTLARQFCEIVDPLMKLRGLNIDQVGSLSQIRDLLLPKLMSGRIRVPVLKENIEAQ